MGYLRRGVVIGTGLAALGGLAFATHFCRYGYKQCHPPRSVVSFEQTARARERLPGLSQLDVTTQDGLKLRSWYVAPRNGVVIVIVTGLGGNRADLLDEAVVFARHGYGSLLLEPRAHGESDGTTATWGYLEAGDVVQAVKLAYAQPDVSAVGALGFSVGASAVALAAVNDASIRAVILYATWTSLREEIAYKAAHRPLSSFWVTKGYELSGVDIDAVHPEPLLRRIAPRPVFLLSGALDRDTPPWVMDRILVACGKPTELWRFPSVGHGGYLQADPQEYERRVMSFWDHAFFPMSPR